MLNEAIDQLPKSLMIFRVIGADVKFRLD